MKAIFKRELHAYFNSLLAYVFGGLILLFAGIYTTIYNIQMGVSSFHTAIASFSFIFLVTVPILTMRTISEDRHNKTDQLLYSLPVTMFDVVMGKYLALLVVFAVPMLIVSTYPLIVGYFGSINMLTAYSTLFAFFLTGAALIAIGIFVSSLTESLALSAGLCFIVMLLNYMLTTLVRYLPTSGYVSFLGFLFLGLLVAYMVYKMTKNYWAGIVSLAIMDGALMFYYRGHRSVFVNLFPTFLEKLSIYDAFYKFPNGIFDITSIVYIVSVIVLFLWLTEQTMEKRRWS